MLSIYSIQSNLFRHGGTFLEIDPPWKHISTKKLCLKRICTCKISSGDCCAQHEALHCKNWTSQVLYCPTHRLICSELSRRRICLKLSEFQIHIIILVILNHGGMVDGELPNGFGCIDQLSENKMNKNEMQNVWLMNPLMRDSKWINFTKIGQYTILLLTLVVK